ncbi:hypothetical protein Dsin_006178 [Dipteronia sinensis]|uniref:Retropepsins domain-containing protein n=1 Tax=Dipteronia sinensis TaxID=43782 RepID=A0AAE0AXX5_9ROSI|nr:hypothetical protein Dsin_006178 [Dipteronia sinensis]
MFSHLTGAGTITLTEEGHYANRCPEVKNKIRTLDISEEIKDKLVQLLYNDISSDADFSDSDSCQSSDNAILAINDTSDSDFSSSSTQSDYQPDKQPCICKEINVLDQHDYSMIIGMIDNISDPIVKAKYIKDLQQKIITNQSTAQSHSTPSVPYSTPDFDSNVIGRFQSKPRKVTISDLQTEIQKLKDEIRLIKINIFKLEQPGPIQNDKNDKIQTDSKFNSSSDSKTNNEDSPNEGINQPAVSTVLSPSHPNIGQIKSYKIQKWYIEIDIRISQDYNLIVNALVDTEADLNCIREALVPTKYLEKTTESLFGANKQQLDIQYKLANAKVCNQGSSSSLKSLPSFPLDPVSIWEEIVDIALFMSLEISRSSSGVLAVANLELAAANYALDCDLAIRKGD